MHFFNVFFKIYAFLRFTNSPSCAQENQDSIELFPKFPTNQTIRWEYPTFTDLGSLVSSFGLRQCLVTVGNFQGVDLVEINYPIITRTLVPLVIKKLGKYIEKEFFGPENLAPRNLTITSDENFDCPISPYFTAVTKGLNRHPTGDICYRLDMAKYWKNSKLFNCLVQIDLYPTKLFMGKFLYYNWHQYYVTDIYNFPLIFPKTFPHSMQIFVTEQPPLHGCCTWGNFGYIFREYEIFEATLYLSCGNLFLAITVEIRTNTFPLKIQTEAITVIKNVRSLNFCFKESFALNVILDPSVISDIRKVSVLSLPKPSSHLTLRIVGMVVTTHGFVNHLLKIFLDCINMPPLFKMFGYKDPTEKLAIAYASVWFALVRNFTILKQDGVIFRLCRDGVKWTVFRGSWNDEILLDFRSYSDRHYHFPYFVQVGLTSLNFVSCGKPRFSSAPFEELIKIFDAWIWIFLIIAAGAMLIPLYPSSKMNIMEIMAHWMSPLQVLLEQGDPFFDRVANENRYKGVLIIYLLAGIVLSNAYKNTNVYNMVLPRKPIPYEFFQDLIKNNFTIYARSTRIIADEPHYRKTELQGKNITHHHHWVRESQFHVLLLSELETFTINLVYGILNSQYIETVGKQVPTFNSPLDNVNLINATKLLHGHWTAKQMAVKMYEYLYSLRKGPARIPWPQFRDNAKVEESKLKENETIALENRLLECNEVALILPQYMCRQYSRLIPGSFVGKEYIPDIQWLFTLKRIVPPHIPIGIKAAHESGIWMRWERLFEELQAIVESVDVTAASMTGNIVVIFCVLLCGLGGAIFCISVEICWSKWLKFKYKRITFLTLYVP